MATATSIFYGYGVNEGFALLVLIMSFVLILPILSKELDYKAGFETKLYKNRLTLYELFSGIRESLFNKSALAAMIFMLFANIGYGIFDVIYNEFYISELGWTGEEIGSMRPYGMWLGGLIGLSAGLMTLYFRKRFLLLLFVTGQAVVYLAASSFTPDTSSFFTSAVLIGVDAVDAGWSVLIFSVLMALCVTQTSATNFGIFMGFGNISMLIGNNIAPSVLGTGDYAFAFTLASYQPDALSK